MKIHTTQNLTASASIPTTNTTMPKRIRNSEKPDSSLPVDRMSLSKSNISFKGAKGGAGKAKFIKVTQEILDKSVASVKKWYDKILTSNAFNKTLDFMSHEVFIQAAISCIICAIFRPLTILAMPTKDKENNKYAAGHAIASGFMGLGSSFLISIPFSKGIKYAQMNAIKNLKEEILAKRYKHLDLKSIWKDKAKGIRADLKFWKDKSGNRFSKDVKAVMTVADPISSRKISEKTWKEKGFDVDLTSQQGKLPSQLVDKNGKPAMLDIKEYFIEVEVPDIGKQKFSLGLMDDKFLLEVFDDLDPKSIVDATGKRTHPTQWKNLSDGKQFMPDLLDHAYISSYNETCSAMPLYNGKVRVETKTGEKKLIASQQNIDGYDDAIVPDHFGTEITQDMLDADATNDITDKMLAWIPDILSRPLVATGTIALLPLILKNVFGLEKKKKPAPTQTSAPVSGKAVA